MGAPACGGIFHVPVNPGGAGNHGYIKLQQVAANQYIVHGCKTAVGAVHIPAATMVILSDFAAGRQRGNVNITWSTASEIDTIGFHL